ncbi:MAG TPA: ABC transporter permease [Candidatus Angelobacter sp.]|nr:ABC transporter permease [Candidatus Angelobacter sp.]
MPSLKSFIAGLRAMFLKKEAGREIDEELHDYLETSAAAKMDCGMDREAALRAARLEMGSLEGVKDNVHRAGWEAGPEDFLRDLRFAMRTLRKSPGFSVLGILTLALGIGANAALFGIVQAVVLKPLGYPHADRLMHIYGRWAGGLGNIPYPDYVAALERSHSFSALAASEPWGNAAITGSGHPLEVRTEFVTPNYLELLGATPVLGRLFLAEENINDGGDPLVIVSHALWQRQYGGDKKIIGQVIQINHAPFTVIGVMSRDFHDLTEVEDPAPDIWLPTVMARSVLGQAPLTDQAYSIYWGLGLLKLGVSVQQAREDLLDVAKQIRQEQPNTHKTRYMDLQPASSYANGLFRRPAFILMSGAVLILLIGCVNVANSMMARIALRRREMALRRALGASSQQLARQLFVECGVLAFAGGALGLCFAVWITGILHYWVQQRISSLLDVHANGWVLAFALALSLGTTLMLGLLSAMDARRVKIWEVLGQSGRQGMSVGRSRTRKVLVIVEVSFSVMLVMGAGLMLRSFQKLIDSGLGFRTDHLLTARVSLSGAHYMERVKRTQFVEALTMRGRMIPGVESISILGPSMLAHATWVLSVFPHERAARKPEDFVQTFRHSISPGTLANLGITMIHGREFSSVDMPQSLPVAVISESIAREFWPNEDAIGRQFDIADTTIPPVTVIGVASDARHRERYSLEEVAEDWPLGGLGPQRDIYMPYQQRPNTDITVALRTTGDEGTITRALTGMVAELDRDLAVSDVSLLDDRLALQNRAPGVLSLLMSGYALLALFLAGLGVYSLILQSVTQRSQEIGIRIALGARKSRVLKMVLKEGMGLVVVGTIAGLLGAVWLAHAMQNLLYGVSVNDPWTAVCVIPLLFIVALAACLSPALKAMNVDPISALRCD